MRFSLPSTAWLFSLALTAAAAETPQGLSTGDWSSIRAAYEAGRHQFFQHEDGTHSARNPGLDWAMKFDERGFTATDGQWTWGLELEASVAGLEEACYNGGLTLVVPRTPHVTEWFINDQRGLEQGWTLTAPAEIRLRVRGNLKASVSDQSVTFGGQITYSGLKAWDANGKHVATHFEATDTGFAVCYDDSGAQYPITIDPMAQNAYLKASNAGVGDGFGRSVVISGDTVVVGAPFEDSNATGVNGNQTDNSVLNSGAAYVFVRSGGNWTQQAYLKASNSGESDYFGHSVAISGDTVVVGAPLEDSNATGVNGNQADNSVSYAGAAYVFVRSGSTWSQQAYLKASNTGENDNFGFSAAISGDTIVVAAAGEASNATGINGNQADNSALLAGAAYVFVRRSSTWSQQAYLKASNTEVNDQFGRTVVISGDTVVVGAVFEASNASGVNGNQADNSASLAGAAYVFVRSGSTWSQQAYLKASNTEAGDYFGWSVAIAGDTIVVGAYGEDSNASGINGNQADNSAGDSGAAYVFVRSGSTWSQQVYLKASNTGGSDFLGYSVAISGDTMVVGAIGEDSNASGINGNQADNSASLAGAAYVFVRSGSMWSQQAYLKASNTGGDDFFGHSVAISGDTMVVGAYSEDSNASGINGNQADNSAEDSGAAYLFDLGEVITSLAKSGSSAPGAPDLNYGAPGFGALSPSGELLWESALTGPGAAAGKNKALFSTVAGPPVDMALQTGSIVSGLLGLPTGAKVATVFLPLHNRTTALFQTTVSGTGITAASNRVLFKDTGAFITPLLRSGQAVAALGNALPSTFTEVTQHPDSGADVISLQYTLKPASGAPATTTATDTGVLLVDSAGAVIHATAREGGPAFGGGTFGQIGRAVHVGSGWTRFLAPWISAPGQKPLNAAFVIKVGGTDERSAILQGQLAGNTTNGEKYGTFLGMTRLGANGLIRSTLSGGAASANEGLWSDGGDLYLRKNSTDLGGGLKAAKILRVWGAQFPSFYALVTLTGPGVQSTSNQALVYRQSDGAFLILARSGSQAPGIGSQKVKLRSLLAVDVNADHSEATSHYIILASLTGAPSSADQVLLSGNAQLGNDTTLKELRLPKLLLRKGDRYTTAATPSGATIKSLSIKPAADASGMGGRGLAQIINDDGEVLVEILNSSNVRELVKLTP